MKTITYLILFHFLLFSLAFFPIPASAHGEPEHTFQESTPEAELIPTEIHAPLENPIATDEALVEDTSKATESYIDTGEAAAEVVAEAEVNRNVVGVNNCFIFLNLYQSPESSVDLATMMPADCTNTQESSAAAVLETININTTDIEQHINASANTGDNLANAGGKITSGDATAAAYISTIANTNVVGSNTLFGVVNVYQQMDKDIILPYELCFLQAGNTNALTVYSLMNNNTAVIENNIYAEANTGENTGSEISTGNSVVLIQMADTINTNILQSGFFLLHVNALAPWNGKLLNFDGQTSLEGDTLTASKNIPLYNGDETENTFAVDNTNETTIENNIQLIANTGGNTGVNSSITTGNATVKAFISNIANTNIVGNNWFHMIVNIFDKFDGNIIFPRPDLVTDMFAKSVGENEAEITVRYANGGTYEGHDVQILTHLPTEAAISSYSGDAQLDGPRIYWNVGTLHKNEIGERRFRIYLEKPGVYTISTSISTSTDEPNKQNNGSHTTITVEQPDMVQPTPLKQNSLMKPLPNITYSRNVQTPPLVTKAVVIKLNSYQLRSTPGKTLGISSVRRPFFVYAFYAIITSIEGRIAQLARALH